MFLNMTRLEEEGPGAFAWAGGASADQGAGLPLSLWNTDTFLERRLVAPTHAPTTVLPRPQAGTATQLPALDW